MNNNLQNIVIVNDVDPITQESIHNIHPNKLIILNIENNQYGFDIDALNAYIAKENENNPRNPFTNKPFSKENIKEIKKFNKKGNHIQPEREHNIWKNVENMGHYIQYKSSFETYKKYEKKNGWYKKEWNAFRKEVPENTKKDVDRHFVWKIERKIKKIYENIDEQENNNNNNIKIETIRRFGNNNNNNVRSFSIQYHPYHHHIHINRIRTNNNINISFNQRRNGNVYYFSMTS